MTALTDRFTRAVDHARIAHAAQLRKGSTIPYLYDAAQRRQPALPVVSITSGDIAME